MFLERVKQIKNNINKLRQSIDDIVLDSVKDNEGYIVELNSEEQLYEQGIYSTGSRLPRYEPMTISIKQGKGQPTDRVTLRDEGDFHDKFFISYGTDSFTIGSSDWKSDILVGDWGKEIFGLTDENIQEAIAITKNDIENRVRLLLNA